MSCTPSTGALASILQAALLLYLFRAFKTKLSFHHPMERHLLSRMGAMFQHPLTSDKEQSQICPFGQDIIMVLVVLLLIRAVAWRWMGRSPLPQWVWYLIFTISLTMGAILNLNAFVYLLPVVFIEMVVIM